MGAEPVVAEEEMGPVEALMLPREALAGMALPVLPVPLDRTPPSAEVTASSASETLPIFSASAARGADEEGDGTAESPTLQPPSAARGAGVVGSWEEEEELPTIWADGTIAIPFEAMPTHSPT